VLHVLVENAYNKTTPPTAGVHPLKLFDTPNTVPTGDVKSSCTYPDRVYATLSYGYICSSLYITI